MNPVTIELLSRAETDNRSKWAEALQLRQQAPAAHPSQMFRLKEAAKRLGTTLVVACQQLKERKASSQRISRVCDSA